MNNEIKWSIRDSLKKFIYYKVEQEVERENILISGIDSPLIHAKEVSSAIDFLIEDGIVKYKNKDELIVTEEYYNWLVNKFKEES